MGGFDQSRWDEGLWDGQVGVPPPPPAIGPPIFLGLIDATPILAGFVDGNLCLGVVGPRAALAPALLGFIDGNCPLGTLNAGPQRLGFIEAAAIRLGLIPIRPGS